MNIVEEFYDSAYDEWGRLDRHRIEFEITKKVLKDYVKEGSRVLDVGGGPGRYSIYLAQQGHKVTMADLSGNMVRQAEENAKRAGITIDRFIKANVLDLDNYLYDDVFDAVLCMGPMYHLLDENERREAIGQCLNHLKPGGIFVASFISSYAPIIDYLKKAPENIAEYKEQCLNYLVDGRNFKGSGFTDAYFIDPEKVEGLFSGFPIETIRVMAAEGLGAICESSLMQLPEEAFMEWMDLLYRIADRTPLLGACEHLIYIGRKESI